MLTLRVVLRLNQAVDFTQGQQWRGPGGEQKKAEEQFRLFWSLKPELLEGLRLDSHVGLLNADDGNGKSLQLSS